MNKLLTIICALGFAAVSCVPSSYAQTEIVSKVQSIISKFEGDGGDSSKVAVEIRALEPSKVIHSHNGSLSVKPASVLKLFTSYVALRELGGSYRFPTDVYRGVRGKDYPNIYVKGYGDPSLVSENVYVLAEDLKRRGVDRIGELVFDDSYFIDPTKRTGYNPYQAAQSALSFNHNSVSIVIAPTNSGSPALVSVTPGAPIKIVNRVVTVSGTRNQVQVSEGGSNGEQMLVVEGVIGDASQGETQYWSVEDQRGYVAGAFAEIFRRVGIEIRSPVRFGTTPSDAKLIKRTYSKELAEILADLNRYSNNFIAQQLTYVLGDTGDGRGEIARGINRILQVLRAVGVSTAGIDIRDGSGLDRENRVSTSQLAQILALAVSDLGIAPEYLASLSRYGISGTLKPRELQGRSEPQVWAKTGTIDGVSSLAGVLQSRSGSRYAFVVISNGTIPKSEAVAFEDQIVAALLNS